MNLDVYDIIYYSNLLISALVGCFLFRKIEIQYKWLTVLIVLTLISEMTAKYVAYGLDKPNSIVYHFFTPLEYVLLVIIFIYFINQKKWNRIITGSAAGLLVFEIVNTINFQPLQETNTNTIILESTLLIGLSLLLFLKIRETPSKQNILKKGVFWFNSAVLCYYSFNIIIWGFHSMKVYLLDNPPQIIYDFNMILSGILYLIYMLAIILNSKRVSETPE